MGEAKKELIDYKGGLLGLEGPDEVSFVTMWILE